MPPRGDMTHMRVAMTMLTILAAAAIAAGCGAPRGVKTEPRTVPQAVANDPEPIEDAFTQAALCQAWDTSPVFDPQTGIDPTHWQLASPKFQNSLRLNYQVPQNFKIEGNGRSVLGDNAIRITASTTQIQRTSTYPLTLYALDLAEEHEGSRISRALITGPGGIEVPAWVLERDIAFAPTEPEAGVWTVHTLLFPLDDRYGKLQARYRREDAWRYRDLVRNVMTTAALLRLGESDADAPLLEDDAAATNEFLTAPAGASGVSAADPTTTENRAGDELTGIPELLCSESRAAAADADSAGESESDD